MIDKGINKTQLCEKTDISINTMAKLGKIKQYNWKY